MPVETEKRSGNQPEGLERKNFYYDGGTRGGTDSQGWAVYTYGGKRVFRTH